MKFKAGDRVLVLSSKLPGIIDSIEETRTYAQGTMIGKPQTEWIITTTFYVITLDKDSLSLLPNVYVQDTIRTSEQDLAPLNEVSSLLYGKID